MLAPKLYDTGSAKTIRKPGKDAIVSFFFAIFVGDSAPDNVEDSIRSAQAISPLVQQWYGLSIPDRMG
jgi:hypothetical protein